MKKRVFPILMAVLMVFAMMPVMAGVVCAEDREQEPSPAISIGAGNIGKGNVFYMGARYYKDWDESYSWHPISWRVLGAANSDDLGIPEDPDWYRPEDPVIPVSSEKATLVISNDILGHDLLCDGDDDQVVSWYNSSARFTLQCVLYGDHSNYYDAIWDFSVNEKTTILATSKTDSAYMLKSYVPFGPSRLDHDRFFILSAEEADDSDDRLMYEDYDEYEKNSYFCGDGSRASSEDWFLRSPMMVLRQTPGKVYSSGEIMCSNDGTWAPDFRLGIRPAFNLYLDRVLFTSAAVGGKSFAEVGSHSLKAIPGVNNNEWKMTLLDSSRDGFNAITPIGAVLSQDQEYTSWSIPVTYSGARSGENEYVSAILCDGSGTAIYYGKIAAVTDSNSASGTVNVTIPTGLCKGSYKLHIFNEQVNEDKRSDYAGAFRTIYLMVNSSPLGADTPDPQRPISIEDAEVVLSATSFTYNGKVRKPAIKTIGGKKLSEGTDYTAEWSNASSKNAGTYSVTITGKGNYAGITKATYTINKAANPLKIKGKKSIVRFKKLKKKKQTLAVTEVITFTKKTNDKKNYKLSSAKKGKKNFRKYFRINKMTGKVTVKKGLKKGSYKLKVKVRAAGNANYDGSAVKTVTFRIKVR